MAKGKWSPTTPWFTDGKKTQAVWPTYVCRNPNCASYGKSHPNCECGAPSFSAQSKSLEYSKGGMVHFCMGDGAHKKVCEYYDDGGEVPTNTGPSVDSFIPPPLKYLKKQATDLLIDEPAAPGDDSIRPVNDPGTAAAGAILAGPAMAGAETAGSFASDLLTDETGAIRKTPTGNVLGTVDAKAGGTTLRQNFLNQAKENGMSLSNEEKGSIPTAKEVANQPTWKPSANATIGMEAAPPEESSLLDQVKARFGDDKKSIKRIDELQDPKLGPYQFLPATGEGYFPNTGHPVPNYASEPTGTIGSDQITHPFPSRNYPGLPTDPVPWMDQKYGVTKQLIKKHQDQSIPLTINTSSDLIAHDDYINAMPKDTTVRMHLLTDNEQTNRALFPGNPSRKRQQQAVEKLRSVGVNVIPIMPTTEKVIEAAGGINNVAGQLGIGPTAVKSYLDKDIGLHAVPKGEDYAHGGEVENQAHASASPAPAPLADGSTDDPASTIGHAAIQHGLVGLLGGTVGSSYLSHPDKGARIIDDAKRQHRFRQLGAPTDGLAEQAPEKTPGTEWGNHIFHGEHDKAADTLQDNPLIGSMGKDARQAIVARLAGPMLEKETNPEAMRSAADYIHSSAQGQKRLKAEMLDLMGKGKLSTHLQEMSRESDRKELKEHLQEFHANPKKLLDISGSLGHYLPDHAGQLGFTAATAMNYLDSIKPKPPQGQPLDADPTPDSVAEGNYDRQLDIANHPLLVLNHIKDGTLDPQDLTTVKTIYPGLYKSLVSEVGEEIINAKAKGEDIPYKHRMGLSMVLGQPLDSTMTQASMMAIITSQGQQTPPAQSNKGPTAQTQKTIEKTDKLYETPEQQRQLDKRE